MSFLEDYKSYASETTDAPPSTHYRIAMSLISACLNRKVYLNQGDDQIYPNLWTMIVAPSGLQRKSTSMRIGFRILDRVDENYHMVSDFSSRERFLECIAAKPRSILFISEFKSFMGMLSRDYMKGMQAILTDLFDCPSNYIKSTKISGDIIIDSPCINLVCCTTSEWLVNSIKDDDIAGGFLPRFLIFCAPKKETSMALRPIADADKKLSLIKQLSKINRIKGEIKLSKQAEDFYTKWFHEFDKSTTTLPGNIISFYSRLTDYALKFGMIYLVNRCAENLEENPFMDGDFAIDKPISEDDIRQGCLMAQSYAGELAEFMDIEVSFSYKERWKKKAEKAIKAKYPMPISREALLRETRVFSKDLNLVLETLEDEKKIRIEETSHEGKGRRRTYVQQAIFWLNGDASQA